MSDAVQTAKVTGDFFDSRFETIFQIEPECVKVLDERGCIRRMNPAGLFILEATDLSQVLGRSFLDFVAPEQRPAVAQAFQETVRLQPVTVKAEITTLAANKRWVESHMLALPRPDNSTEILAITRDVTRAHLAEQALQESETRFRQLAEAIQEVFWMFEFRTGRLLYVSPAYEKIWGRSISLLWQQPLSWCEAIHPDDRARVKAAIDQRAQTGNMDTEYRITRPDGSVRWIHDRSFPVPDHDGKIYRLAGLATDITQRKEAETRNAAMEASLRQSQKMEALGVLAGGIAHDFNNILLAIMGNVELVRMDFTPDHPSYEPLNESLRAAHRAGDLVRQILAFSRKTEHQKKVSDIRPVVKEVVQLLRAALPATIRIETRIDPQAPSIVADTTQIHQIFMNLATNASHAMRENGGVLEIALSKKQFTPQNIPPRLDLNPGHYLRLCVHDTGQGMPPEVLERIFEPFYTTKSVGEGTGLGLSVVHGIVKAHDGAILVQSEPGHGTYFEIFFPAVAAETRGETVQDEPPRGHGERILIVDDEPALRQLISTALGRYGYESESASDPTEALDRCAADPKRFAAILSDFTMPKMTGLDFAHEVRRLLPETPVILITGYAGHLQTDRLKAIGISEVLLKPFTAKSIAHSLGRALQSAPVGHVD